MRFRKVINDNPYLFMRLEQLMFWFEYWKTLILEAYKLPDGPVKKARITYIRSHLFQIGYVQQKRGEVEQRSVIPDG